MQEKVSIIVPVYNVERELERCIESLINQTYPNIEIILVDDGSTDCSGIIADQLHMRWPEKLIVIHQRNCGLSGARNTGIDRACGKYLMFVDSDDYLELDAVNCMLQAVQDTDADIAVCGRYDDYPNKRTVRFNCDKQILLSGEALMGRILTWDGFDIAAWDKLYRASLWENIRFPLGFNNEDICTLPSILLRCRQAVHVGKPLYHYCHRESSITTSYSKKKVQDFYHAIHALNTVVRQGFPDLTQQLRYFNNHSYLNLWIMCDRISYRGPELQEAKTFLKENWKDPFSREIMSKQNHLFYRLLQLRLFGVARVLKTIVKGQ